MRGIGKWKRGGEELCLNILRVSDPVKIVVTHLALHYKIGELSYMEEVGSDAGEDDKSERRSSTPSGR